MTRNAERRRDRLDCAQELGMGRCIPVDGDGHLLECRSDLPQQSEPLAGDGRLEILKPGDVAIGMRKAVYKSATDGIRNLDENGRCGLAELLQCGPARRCC